ncbi:MAG: hypothetical protein J5706_00365 [Elusimicrobiales bacterium]|nr:hypothetical protein [Elusimicrobiales bacterium]
MTEKAFIKTKKIKIYVYALIAVCICAASCFIIFSGISDDMFIKTLCWIAAAISGIFFLILLPVIKADTGIAIDSEKGITDCTKFSKIGPIPWQDIISFEKTEIKTEILHNGQNSGKSVSRTYITAKINSESPFGEILAGINMNIMPGGGGQEIIKKMGAKTLIINTEMLDCSADSLFETLQQIHKEKTAK